MKVYEAIAQAVADEGCENVFGVMGDVNMYLWAALSRIKSVSIYVQPIQLIVKVEKLNKSVWGGSTNIVAPVHLVMTPPSPTGTKGAQVVGLAHSGFV